MRRNLPISPSNGSERGTKRHGRRFWLAVGAAFLGVNAIVPVVGMSIASAHNLCDQFLPSPGTNGTTVTVLPAYTCQSVHFAVRECVRLQTAPLTDTNPATLSPSATATWTFVTPFACTTAGNSSIAITIANAACPPGSALWWRPVGYGEAEDTNTSGVTHGGLATAVPGPARVIVCPLPLSFGQ